jgi:hypothetical protein
MKFFLLHHVAVWIEVAVGWVAPIYILWSILAIASRSSRLLGTLASHGKTRRSIQDEDQKSQQCRLTSATRLHNMLLPTSSWWIWVPKQYFSHFYLVGQVSLWLVVAVTASVRLASTESLQDVERASSVHVADALPPIHVWLTALHLARRFYECRYVHQWTSGSKMSLAGYILGMVHYHLLPLVVVVPVRYSGGLERHSESNHHGSTNSNLVTILIGITLNLLGQYEQYQHHVVLADLRRQWTPQVQHSEQVGPSSTRIGSDYNIPCTRGFQWIACPHYLAEIVIYFSLAILIETTITSSTMETHSDVSNQSCKFANREGFLETVEQDGTVCRLVTYWLAVFLDWAKVYRHWWLFGWVGINLSISAWNTLEWNRRAVERASSLLSANERSTMLRTMQKQKALVPWIF